MYMQETNGILPVDLVIEHFDLEHVQLFCKYLEDVRGNKAVTINNRIAAIKSFMHYVSEMAPEYNGIAKRTTMIPLQKCEIPAMDFLSKGEFEAMIEVCDTSTYIGARDKLMLLILYNTGVRVSELVALKWQDFVRSDTPDHAYLKINGKGRKQRTVPL